MLSHKRSSIEDSEKILFEILESIGEEDLLLKTLWVFHTYLFNVQGSTVYLHFTGMPGTGKSTAQKVLNQICWNSEYCCNLSESSLFREIDSKSSTEQPERTNKDIKVNTRNFLFIVIIKFDYLYNLSQTILP